MTGNIAAIIDRMKAFAATALELYTVYISAILNGRPVKKGDEIRRKGDILREETHENCRHGITEQNPCERWDDPMRLRSTRPRGNYEV
jgi:hypothetical protein